MTLVLGGTLALLAPPASRGWADAPPMDAANPAPHVTITMEIDGGAAYLKQDLNLKLTFVNRSEPTVTIDPEAFALGAFSIRDARGRAPALTAGAAGATESLVVPGFAAMERRVSLSAWYPKLTSKKTSWEIAWSHPPYAPTSMTVRIIPPHDPLKDRFAVVETDLGTMKWELLPDLAPLHVRRFVDLARQGHYDGLTFFRYIRGVQADGGAPAGETGSWERLMPPEIAADFVPKQGMVGALRPEGSSASSMTSDSLFFVTLGDAGFMQGTQTFFARIDEGYEAMARMNQVENRGLTGDARAFLLVKPVTIRKVTITRR
jgi:cyclophilin family peptidyl-prolyl cis-trans isomerase